MLIKIKNNLFLLASSVFFAFALLFFLANESKADLFANGIYCVTCAGSQGNQDCIYVNIGYMICTEGDLSCTTSGNCENGDPVFGEG